MITTPLDDTCAMIRSQVDALGIARNAYLSKKAEKRNLEAVLKQQSQGASQAERSMNADATLIWLNFEKELARLESVYDFQKDKLEVMNKEFQSRYLELKDNELAIKRQT